MASNSKLTVERIAKTPWHSLSLDDALKELEASEEGLSRQEVEQRKKGFGPNKLPEKKRAGLLRVFFRQFKDPLIYILLIAAIVSLGIGNLNNAIFIFAVLLINAVIGTFSGMEGGKGCRGTAGDDEDSGDGAARR